MNTNPTVEKQLVTTWFGRPIDELSRDELIIVINHCGKEIQHLRDERQRMARSVDWADYLLKGKTT